MEGNVQHWDQEAHFIAWYLGSGEEQAAQIPAERALQTENCGRVRTTDESILSIFKE